MIKSLLSIFFKSSIRLIDGVEDRLPFRGIVIIYQGHLYWHSVCYVKLGVHGDVKFDVFELCCRIHVEMKPLTSFLDVVSCNGRESTIGQLKLSLNERLFKDHAGR